MEEVEGIKHSCGFQLSTEVSYTVNFQFQKRNVCVCARAVIKTISPLAAGKLFPNYQVIKALMYSN